MIIGDAVFERESRASRAAVEIALDIVDAGRVTLMMVMMFVLDVVAFWARHVPVTVRWSYVVTMEKNERKG